MADRRLADCLPAGVPVRLPQPSLTIYRMAFTDATGADRTIVGVMCGLEVVDLDAGGVRPERTTPKPVIDRVDLTAPPGPTSPGVGAVAGPLPPVPGEPVGQMVADGVVHTVEHITHAARIASITAILAADDVLIADDHHRKSISRSYRDEVRAATGREATEADFTLIFINELNADRLSIETNNRGVYTNICIDELRAVLSACFDVEPAPAPTPRLVADMVALGRLVLIGPETT